MHIHIEDTTNFIYILHNKTWSKDRDRQNHRMRGLSGQDRYCSYYNLNSALKLHKCVILNVGLSGCVYLARIFGIRKKFK